MDLKGAILRNFYQVGTLVKEANPSEYFSLKVPHYQRPYRWDASRVAQLIKDWNDNKGHSNSNESEDATQDYFAGAVVTVASDNSEEHSLIDGQQRVTTLFLTNYISFTIVRHLLIVELENGYSGKIDALSKQLRDTAQYLFRSKEIVEHFKKTSSEIGLLSDDVSMGNFKFEKVEYDKGKLSENPIDKYYKKLWIPKTKLGLSGEVDRSRLEEETVNTLTDHIKNDSLNLHYDRDSYNASLAKVLIHFFIDTRVKGLEGYVLGSDDSLSESEKVYITALSTILDEFKAIAKNRDTIRSYLLEINELINSFLNQVKLCVIQTGAVDDAYTLFEVMNDRALALDDLDLIKNQFFKEFVQKNNELSEKELDEKIQSLDKQWGDDIFNHRDIREYQKKLISYFSTVFLTGNTSITNKRNEKYRVHLSDYLRKTEVYNYQMIQRDFNVFQVCYELIQTLRLPYKRRENESLGIEYRIGTTDFHKTMLFLNALQQDGVTSGLVNFVLCTIASFSKEFNVEFSKKFIERLLMSNTDLKNDLDDNVQDQELKTKISVAIQCIQEQSKVLWRISMMALTADVPRELAKDLIAENNISTLDTLQNIVVREVRNTHNLIDEFSHSLKQWNYDKSSKFKIKTLFARLLKLDQQDGRLVSTSVRTMIDTNLIEELELDHLVPQNGRNNSLFQFASDDERELYANGLGNMMPLPKKENIQKSNYPLEESLKFYELCGLKKHFLLKELEDLINELKDGKIKTSDFFSQRKEKLVSYFEEVVKS